MKLTQKQQYKINVALAEFMLNDLQTRDVIKALYNVDVNDEQIKKFKQDNINKLQQIANAEA